MSEIIMDTIHDTYLMFPLLFITYFIIEYANQKESKQQPLFFAMQKYGVIVGAFVGLIPQCGFSIIAAMLYLQKNITLGTMISVFIATSDEAIPVLLVNPSLYKDMVVILALKVVLAISVGYFVDKVLLAKHTQVKQILNVENLHEAHCVEDEEGTCTCHDSHRSFVTNAFLRSFKIFLFLFLTTLVLNIVIALIGEQNLHQVLLSDSLWQPFIAALFGFIPNCAATVVLTQLYVGGGVSFASLFAGLVSNASLGLLVLMRYKASKKDLLSVIVVLYISAILAGLILQLW